VSHLRPRAPYPTRVLAVILAAALTCGGALILGQVACRLCGARSWSFLAAPVGLALLMLLSVPAVHVPGHATTIALLLLVLSLAGIALLIREPALRPRPADLLSAAPVFFLVLLPFLVNGRAGTLGVSFDNDMHAHLLWAEAIRSPSVAKVTSLDPAYPIGPHALCAVLAQATGMRVDFAFAGETLALPILLAWTALVALGRVGWLGKTFVASTCALTFMIAGYYVEGSFKEIVQALFVLGFALGLEDMVPSERHKPLRWVPLALIAGGSLSVYSVAGLPWLLATLGLWLLALGAGLLLRSGSPRRLIAGLRDAVLPASIGLGVLLVLIVPQLPRLVKYYENSTATSGGTGIPISALGNLLGPVSFWKVFGMWDVADFRQPPADPFQVGMYAAFGLLLTVGGGIWWLRRGGLAVPLGTGVALAIWIYSNNDQSPYVAAKALAILAPLVMLVATRWLVELRPGESWLSSVGALRVGVAGLFGWAVLGTSVETLRYAYVGATAHVDDLRSLEPTLGRSPTLFLGWDNFIKWELAGTPVDQPNAEEEGAPAVALRPQKMWTPGEALEFDDIQPATLDHYRYIITTRDPAASQPPSNMRLIRTGRYYEVWERRGLTPERQILAEGQEPGAVLNCATAQGRALARTPGEAALRPPNVIVPVPAPSPGETTRVQLRLKPGSWWLSAPYISPHPIEVTAPGLRTTLPANFDRPGMRWPVGSITVTRNAPLTVTFHPQDPPLAPAVASAVNALIATPDEPVRFVPLGRACGRYVEWYTTSARH
jgi:hypothetical protein